MTGKKALILTVVLTVVVVLIVHHAKVFHDKSKKIKDTEQVVPDTSDSTDASSVIFRGPDKLKAYNVFMTETYTKTVPCREIRLTVFEYDSCEYIQCGQGIVHKHNCKYCAARAGK